MDAELQAAYLRRLGLEAEPPSAEALQRLHRRHVERVPYETLWIAAGEAWGIDPADSVVRVALQHRGGYCYHLNGAFSELLASLGYDVRRHVGGVHGPNGPEPSVMSNHLVLTVSGLPTDEHPAGVWYVDAGLGDAMYDPLPLVAGVYEQAPFRLELTEPAAGEWHLAHDPTGSFPGMSWSSPSTGMHAFADKHVYLSTSPESGFTNVGMAEVRDSTGVDVVRGLLVSRVGEGATTSEPLTDRAAWLDAVRTIGVRFDATPPELVDRLWGRMLELHRAWEAKQAAAQQQQ